MARRRRQSAARAENQGTDYTQLTHGFPRAEVFSTDQVEAIHGESLRVLEELGIRILNDEAREMLRAAGCEIRDDMMVHLPADLVEAEIARAPRRFTWHGATGFSVDVAPDTLIFGPGAGCPNATDLDRGRRPGTLADLVELLKIQEGFDILQKIGPMVEAQDVPVNTRHVELTRIQLENSRKIPFVFARGSGQTEQALEMIRIARGVDMETFRNTAYASTVVNTNSPRQIDVPMAQGIIDFARWGQVCVITPFCLAGAMAPITTAGALMLSHAEALAGIALSQIARPGAPVIYGAFSSNVDMKSGAPVFGTPEHIHANLGAGQLARRIGLPWRSGSGTASNAPDVQGAMETQAATWGAVLGGANLIYHAAGWLEGGLTISYEKLITDLEICQTIARAMEPVEATPEAIGFDAVAEVPPGGHFFAATQTMNRYATQFYEPLTSDWSNFGQWHDAGAVDTTKRAHALWKEALRTFTPPPMDVARKEELAAYAAARIAEGGAVVVD